LEKVQRQLKGGNTRHVLFDAKPDNLHWVWDTGMLEQIDRNPEDLAARLEANTTDQDGAAWVQGSIEEWVLEGDQNPAAIDAEYERKADPVIELQLEKAGVRVAYLLKVALP
jgi:hypothetical protein